MDSISGDGVQVQEEGILGIQQGAEQQALLAAAWLLRDSFANHQSLRTLELHP